MLEVQELNYLDYLLYKRDAFIYRMSQTEKGQEYLDKAWIYSRTDPDIKSLRRQFGKGARTCGGQD